MEHDSSRSGYHEPKPVFGGLEEEIEDWGDDFPKTFSVNLIWAQAFDEQGKPGAIGYQGGMPWHLAEDLRRFKELTVSHPVIMGRKTWESLGKYAPLPNRDNIVVSSMGSSIAPGASVVRSLEEALDIARQEAIPDDGLDRSEIWVIGGSRIFEEALSYASKIFVTKLSVHVPCDTYAPNIEGLVKSGQWRVIEETPWLESTDSRSTVSKYAFVTYARIGKPRE